MGCAAIPTPASACTCDYWGDAANHMARVDVVFRGKAIRTRLVNKHRAITTFDIMGMAKGEPRRNIDVAHGPAPDGSCGVSFMQGSAYVVGATLEDDLYRAGLCDVNAYLWRQYRRAGTRAVSAE